MLNCLIRNTALKDEIQGIIVELVEIRLVNKQSVKIQDIYKDIRSAGMEVDAESVGSLYNEAFALKNSKLLSTENEIEQYVGAEFKQTIKDVQNAIVGSEESESKEKQTGKMSPEKSIVNSLGKLFQKQFYPTSSQTTQSNLLQMQNLVKKALQSKLPKDKKINNPLSVNQMFKDFFGIEENKFDRIDGGVNNLETLYDEVKKQVKEYVDSITKDMDDTQKAIVQEQWDNYTQSFMDSMYDIMLSNGQQQKLLNEALQNVQIDGKDLTDKNGNIKWSELSKDNNVDEIRDKIQDLFENGFTDKAGNNIEFTPIQASRIADYYANLYQQKINDIIQKDIANERAKNKSPKNLVSDFIKEQGYFQLIKDKSGQLTKMKTTWDDLIKEIKLGDNEKGMIDQLQDKLDTFLRQTDANGNRIFDITDEKINEAKKALEVEIKSKLLPSTATPNNINKLASLSQINNGIAFNQSTQQALTKIVGVPDITQEILNKIEELSQLSQSIISNPDTIFAQQALAQIDRKIRELIFEIKLDSKIVSVLQKAEDIMSALKSTLLFNPYNIPENIFTNIGSLGFELFRTIISSPKGTKRKLAKEALKTLMSAYASHISGGSHENVVNDYDKIKDLSSGERFRFNANDKNIDKNTALKLSHTAMRVIMNSFDVATMETLIKIQSLNSLSSGLVKAYGAEKGKELMNKMMSVSDTQLKNLDTQINDMVSEMNKNGIYPTVMDKALMKRNAIVALYLQNLDGIDTISATDKKRIRDNMMGVIKGVSESSRLIGGKQAPKRSVIDVASLIPSLLGSGILGTQSYLLESSQKLRESGYKRTGQALQFVTTSLIKNGIGSFLGGRLNFLYLALTYTPLGFLSATSNQWQLHKYKKDKGSQVSDIRTSSPDEYQKYIKLSQQVRSIMARAVFGSLLMTAYAVSNFTDDDEDEEDGIVENLMKTQSGRNLLMKFAPLYITSIAYILTNSPDEKVDSVKKRVIDFGKRLFVMNPNWDYAERAIEKAQNGNQLTDALVSFIGSNYNANFSQDEQVTKAIDVVKSAIPDEDNEDDLLKVLQNESISKRQYKQMEDVVEKYVGLGATEKLLRIMGYKITSEGIEKTDEPINRFKEN